MDGLNGVKEIEGIVDSVTYCNPENGYIVLELSVKDEHITVVGELGDIEAGEELTVMGDFVRHSKYGVQFSAVSCQRKLPQTADAMFKYLSSRAIKGIGSRMAKRIVDEFGDETFHIIENEPEKLAKIKGISPKKAEEISAEFKHIFGMRALMIFLAQYGVAPSAAVRAWRKWGQYAVDIIKENPYCLCGRDIELQFEKAEEMAEKMDFPMNSDSRIAAGINHVLSANLNSGHTCLPYDRLKSTSVELLNVDEVSFDRCLDKECDEENIVRYDKNGRSFVYLSEYYTAEKYIADRLQTLSSFLKDTGDDISRLIEAEEAARGISYAQQQKRAISLALTQGFMILTGGPGTGKTTALKAILSLYEQRGMRVMLAAPTGKAAKRISELTDRDAKTIHRMLEVTFDNSGKTRFKHNENDPLPCDVMIVDEMSMVDTLLFESLLRALKLSCRLIMVGDSDQLPSVGAGNVLKDMIDCGRLPVVQLTEIFRQAQQSCIVTNAHKIVRGMQPDLSRTDSDFFFMQYLNSDKVSETVVDLVVRRLPKAYGYSSLEDIQVLCPPRKGALGVNEMNKVLQLAINPSDSSKPEVKGIMYPFRKGDKVMQIKNNYDIEWSKNGERGTGIFNGDIGIISDVVRSESKLVIDFDGRTADYPFEMLDQLELAYAITVHKSQGSEFNAVILPLLGGYEKLFYRNLLYTAVTRAKKLLIIVGSGRVVEAMVNNDRRMLRYTCLRDMLEKEIDLNDGNS